MDIQRLIDYYCRKQGLQPPVMRKSMEETLYRMKNIGLVTQTEIDDYLSHFKTPKNEFLP